MNRYRIEFFARCRTNGVRIKYALTIETIRATVLVEEIVAGVSNFDDFFHEEIADFLLTRFGGSQTLVAEHHGVTIETQRP